MTVNAPLMFKTLDYIRDHPGQWNQGEWAEQTACGTVACFAGTAVMLTGYDFDFTVYEDEVRSTDKVTTGDNIRDVATIELGLTAIQADFLFYGGNTLEDLEQYVGLITHDLPMAIAT